MFRLEYLFCLVVAYLLGSIPFAYIIGRLKGIDIRRIGDSNVGAFNVFRHVGLLGGISTLALDMGKGALAVIIPKLFYAPELIVLISGGLAVIGHNWPVFLKFRGGRGVSTTIGILFVLIPIEMLVTFLLALIILAITKNSIWTGVLLFVPLPIICFLLNEPLSMIIYSIALPCVTGITHWITTRHLTNDAKKESEIFWLASNKDRNRKRETDL